uniref:Pseudouridylate synthase RPUSD4, mitochondrial n=1 Tax=Oncorhynchus mykiss TaxID=8022 RepID=A0A8C7T2Y0_ONCMY
MSNGNSLRENEQYLSHIEGSISTRNHRPSRKIRLEKQKGKAMVCPHCQKRFIELRQFTQQLSNIHPNVLAKHLKRDNVFTCLLHYVLAKVMAGMRAEPHSQLEVRLGLDKETTGTLLLARTDETPDYVQNLHKKLKVERKYWCLASVIDSIFVRNVLCNCIHLTAHNPSQVGLSPVYRVSVGGERVTNVQANRDPVRVLDSSNGCSLVELQPITGVRIHTPAYALGCHILGDHKNFHLR